ncbi:hypothetical protein [Streptomyces sp. NPDC006195]
MSLDSWRNQGRVVLAEVTDILAQQLTPATRAQLGLAAWPDDAAGLEASYLAVRFSESRRPKRIRNGFCWCPLPSPEPADVLSATAHRAGGRWSRQHQHNHGICGHLSR